jgi:hypothetical protein
MPNITVAVADAQNAALAAEATARSTDDAPVTATHIATAVVTSHADRIRRDDYIGWFKGLGVDGMQRIHDANQ